MRYQGETLQRFADDPALFRTPLTRGAGGLIPFPLTRGAGGLIPFPLTRGAGGLIPFPLTRGAGGFRGAYRCDSPSSPIQTIKNLKPPHRSHRLIPFRITGALFTRCTHR